jgi:hypothetical protein
MASELLTASAAAPERTVQTTGKRELDAGLIVDL